MAISQNRVRRMKEMASYEVDIQCGKRYREECGKCITRKMTPEEIRKYESIKGDKRM